MTVSSPADCVAFVTERSTGQAVVLADSARGLPLDGLARRDVDATTALRWVSRPVGEGARLLALEGSGKSATLVHLGADPLTGDVVLTSLLAEDPPPVDQLRGIGVPCSATDDGHAVAAQDALAAVLRFVVVPQDQAPGEPRRDRPPAVPQAELPWDLTDSRFIGLMRESGAPLEVIWHVMWESAGVRWCLLNRDLDVEDVARIPYRHAFPASEFLRALRVLTEAGVRGLDLPVYVMTGPRQGHAIHLQAFEGEEVVYHDPWPGRSLLAKGNNRMDIAARPEDGRRLWRIATHELASVAYAALVEPATWLPFCGVEVDVTLDAFAASSLTTFFGFHETGRTEDGKQQVTHIAMAPGNWQEHISLVLTVDAEEKVTASQLLVDRSWIDDPATKMFAADLLKSYVQAVVPEADGDDADLLARGLATLATGRLAEVLGAGPPHLLDQLRLVTLTAVGAAPFARAMLPCSTIRDYNVVADDGRRQLAIVVSRARDEPGPLFEDHESGYFMDEYREYLWSYLRSDLTRLGWLPADTAEPSG